MKVKKDNKSARKNRKQLRKDARVAKKARKNEYYMNRNKLNKNTINDKNSEDSSSKHNDKAHNEPPQLLAKEQQLKNILKERKEKQKLEKEMQKHRGKQLLESNAYDDKIIKNLEKKLKLNKRKSQKKIPKSFVEDGLDFLLEVCDPETVKSVAATEEQFTVTNDELAEDLALITNQKASNNKSTKSKNKDNDSLDEAFEYGEEMSDDDDISDDDDESESEEESEDDDSGLISNEDVSGNEKVKFKKGLAQNKSSKNIEQENESESDDDFQDDTDYYYNDNDDDVLDDFNIDNDLDDVEAFQQKYLKECSKKGNKFNTSDDESSDEDNNDVDDSEDDNDEENDDDNNDDDDGFGGSANGRRDVPGSNNDYFNNEDDDGVNSSDDYDNNNVDNNNDYTNFGNQANLKSKIDQNNTQLKQNDVKSKKISQKENINAKSSKRKHKTESENRIIKKRQMVEKTNSDNSDESNIRKQSTENKNALHSISGKNNVRDKQQLKRKGDLSESSKNTKKKKFDSDDEIEFDDDFDELDDADQKDMGTDDDVWEDIYGRKRAKDGTVIAENTGKYMPPAIRAKMEEEFPTDKKRIEKLNRLKRTLKGLLNRLAESNMHSIVSQIEDLYMNNSRNDMNDTLTNLVLDSCVSSVVTPERLLLEHVTLITILHANVGTEVGAHFLQTVINKFHKLFNSPQEVEDKTTDNIINIIAQLYNFKMFHSNLLYQILAKLSEKFDEKCIECILLVLKNVGFSLRKDDPLALKNLILDLQKQANNSSEETRENARVKYMLDILLAIKNNNVKKIPNYDNTYSEHLKKLLKGFIRKGCYVTQLNISLDDLLKAEERGKWWVVGSAWTGTIDNNNEPPEKSKKQVKFSQKLLELARKQRMNTDTRRNIFCILMSAEDYLDAFEKLLRLGLKNQEEREIINIILHCCLKEKVFNPYYAVLTQRFCEYDRRFQMVTKCSVWDKLKSLADCSAVQLSNLAKLLSHLFLEKGLPISTLKIIQFSEVDKITTRFIRQVLLSILIHDNEEQIQEIFLKVKLNKTLKLFRESLKLFIHHFILKHINDTIPENVRQVVEERSKIIDMCL